MTDYTPPPRLALTDNGRQILAQAVTVDHDWNLPSSGVDKLIAALAGLTDDDLDVAYLIAGHLAEAVACVQIQRDMTRDRDQNTAIRHGARA